MYDQHVPLISAAMRADPATFAKGCMFAVLSARVQFHRVPGDLKTLERDGAQAHCLWGWKAEAYAYIEAHKPTLWETVCACADTSEALWQLNRVPGIGIAKGAFILQMLGHDIACLDVRNIVAEKRNPRAYETRGRARQDTKALRRLIDRYVADTGGKARYYWDRWCEEVGPDYGMTGEQCSAVHLCVIPTNFRLTTRKETLKTALLNEAPF